MYDVLRKYIDRVTGLAMSDDEYNLLQNAFSKKIMKKRQFLLHEGSICKYMTFIVKGAMRLYNIDEKGNEHIVRFGIEEWWISDRESLVMLTPSKYNIDAVEDCELLVTTHEWIIRLKEQSPTFSKLAQTLDQNSYVATHKRIEAVMSFTAEEKYLELAKTYPEFLQRFPQSMLASYLGLTPETLSRVRKQVLSR